MGCSVTTKFFFNRTFSSLLAVITLAPLSHTALAYTYADYARDYSACNSIDTPKQRAVCQKEAKITLECSKLDNEERCLKEKGHETPEQKVERERIAQQRAIAEAEAEAEAKRERAAWAADVDQRATYGTGKWLVREGDPDPIDDSRVVVLSLKADSGRSGLEREPVHLIIRCSSNKTSVFINWHDYMTDESVVTHRLDKNKPEKKIWPSSTDKTASFYPGDGHAFAKQLMLADSFVARTTPYNENPVTAIFDTRGLSHAIRPLREACRW